MSTRRTRRTAAAAEATEEVITVETRSKRTRAAPRKAATTTATSSTKSTKVSTRAKRAATPTAENTPAKRANTQSATRQDPVTSTPAPATNTKRRLRSTATESASPLRALDEQPAKRQRTVSRKTPARSSAAAKSMSSEEDDDEEETPLFFTKKFDSFNVEDPEPKKAFMQGDESAMALLRHVREAARSPRSVDQVPKIEASPAPPKSSSSSPATGDGKPSTPTRSIFASFATPFTALKSLFSTPAPPSSPAPLSTSVLPASPTPSRLPPPNTFTEVLSMPPTPIGERKRTSKKGRRPNRIVKALLQGVDQEDIDKATAWAEKVATDLLQKDSTAGDKRKRLETPVLFRDLQHFPASKPWQSGFSFPDDVLDLEDDDIVPAWAVYTSMIEEEQRRTKKTKTAHADPIDDDMPASLNDLFGTSTASELDFQPRRSIEPSPMFETPLKHNEGGNIFTELHGHDAVAQDRKSLQRELKAGSSQLQAPVETSKAKQAESLPRVHDPLHGSFSVPDSDSDSDDDEEVSTPSVWTQAPPPAPTPAHVSLPNSNRQEEVERQRQKLMKHTPHKPSRLQQVSYPSPSVMSDAGDSPMKLSDFGEIPNIEPLYFGDADLDAAVAALANPEGLQAHLSTMHWSTPVITYDSDEEALSPL